MPTLGLGRESMINNSQYVSCEASTNEDVQQTYHDVDDDDNEDVDGDEDDEVDEEEVELGQGKVPRQLPRTNDKGRIIIRPFGKG
jgi:hypothetical protein